MNTEKITKKIALLFAAMTLMLPLGAIEAYAQAAPSTGFGLGAIKVPGGEKAKTGTGLTFGRSVFHAGLSAESGWDSNVYYTAESGTAQSSGYMRLLPQLTLGTRPVGAGQRQSFVYNLALALDYVGYFQDIPKRHHLGASLGADLKFNPKGLVSFNLIEQFVRTNEPRAGMDGSVDRDYNQIGFDLAINKGLLSFLLGYRFMIDMYEQEQFNFANRMQHQVKFKATWKFFPQTSFWFLAQSGYVGYLEDFDAGAIGEPAGGNSNSVPLHLWLGATGRLTHWLTADLALGYGFARYTDTAASYHDFIANAGFGIKMGASAKLSIGYRKDFRDSVVGDLYRSNSAYARLNIAIARRLLLNAMFAWTRADYQNYNVGGNVYERKDNYLLGSVGADYHFISWLSAGIGYSLQANIASTDAQYTDPGGGGTIAVQPGFVKHRVFGRVTAFY